MELELKNELNLDERITYLKANINNLYYKELMDKNYNELVENTIALADLEKYANYLLKAVSADERDFKDITQEQWNEEIRKKESQFAVDENGNEIDMNEEDGQLKKNIYKSNDITVTSKLLKEDSELGKILREYQPVRKHLSKELQKYKEKKGNTSAYEYGFIRRNLKELKYDMILTIKYKKGLDVLRPLPTKRANIDLDTIRYSSITTIKAILRTISLDTELSPSNDLSIIAEDIRVAIRALQRQKELNEVDLKVILGINEGLNLREVALEVGISHVGVSKKIDRIAEKISKQLTRKI